MFSFHFNLGYFFPLEVVALISTSSTTVIILFEITSLLCLSSSGVHVLYRLGLTASSSRDPPHQGPSSPSSSSSIDATSPSPQNRLPPGAGVLLDSDSVYQAPASLLSPEISNDFSVVVSLSSWQANNAFLLSVKDDQDRLRFGVQLLPRRVVVYTAPEASVHFTYDWQDGHQHSFALGVRKRSVSFHANCGAVYQWEQTLGRPQFLGGLLTLGRMNSKAAPFQGRICQLDLYPSAQAAAHYCHYLRKQCRLADTFPSSPAPAGVDVEANNPPFQPSIESSSPEAGSGRADRTPNAKAVSEQASLFSYHSQYSTLRPSVQPHLGELTYLHLGDSLVHTPTPSVHQQTGTPSATTNRLEGLDLTLRTISSPASTSMPFQGTRQPHRNVALFENNTEGEGSPRRPHNPGPPTSSDTVTSSGVQTPPPRLTVENLEVELRANRTTLYRHNQLDTSEEHGGDESYDNGGAEGYDYGYDEPDYFYDYEGFLGLKGDPGPEVGAFMNGNHCCQVKSLFLA